MSEKIRDTKTHTLLALIGHSPQVITESIFALHQHHNIDISELKVVTTSANRKNTWQSLSKPRSNGKSALDNIAMDYGFKKINFCYDDILVPIDANGDEIQDVKSELEMKAVAQFLLSLVREKTSDKNTSLHASLAGGRKTMTFYLSYAMSIYGRPQDSLSHVFVSYPYESSEFYYPTPYSHLISTKKGFCDAKDAVITLANIPHVQLRSSLPNKFIEQDISFEESEKIYAIINAAVSLIIKIKEHVIVCSGVELKLSPANFAFYLLMVDDLLNAHEGFDGPSSEEPDALLALLYLNKRLKLEGHPHKFVNLAEAIDYADNHILSMKTVELEGLKAGLKKTFFNDRKNQISKLLRNELPEVVAEHYDIDSIEKITKYGSSKKVNYFGLNIEQNFVSYR